MTLLFSDNFDSQNDGDPLGAGWASWKGQARVYWSEFVSPENSCRIPVVAGWETVWTNPVLTTVGLCILDFKFKITWASHSIYGDSIQHEIKLKGLDAGVLKQVYNFQILTAQSPGTWIRMYCGGVWKDIVLDTWYRMVVFADPATNLWYLYLGENPECNYVMYGGYTQANGQGIGYVWMNAYTNSYFDDFEIYDSSGTPAPYLGLDPRLEVNGISRLIAEINEVPISHIAELNEVS